MIVEQHDRRRAARHRLPKTSRGWTMLASSVPTESTVLRSTRCFVSSSSDAELLDAPVAVLRQQDTRRPRGLVICARRVAACATVRRPSSTAASTCAARAGPMPPTRVSSSARRAASPQRRRRAASTRWPDRARSRAAGPDRARSRRARCRRARAAPSRASFSRGRSCAAMAFIVHHPCYTAGRCAVVAVAICTLALPHRLLRTSPERNRSRTGRHRRRARRRRRPIRRRTVHRGDRPRMQQTHEAVAAARLPARAVARHRRQRARARSGAAGRQRQGACAERSGRGDHRAATAVRQLDERLKAAEAARLPARDLDAARNAHGDAERALQEARAAMAASDYAGVRARVDGLPERSPRKSTR